MTHQLRPLFSHVGSFLGGLTVMTLVATPVAILIWLQTSIVENMHRKFIGTPNSELMSKFKKMGFYVVSLEAAKWNHPNGLNLTPVVFFKAKEHLVSTCPEPHCRFHAARKTTPYLSLFKKVERAAWATRDGEIVGVFGEHHPMVGNL
ncbi:hypothetical protein [uncultured Tateyamaria sp.]|uniref:hypothetical protein n=1 Tax=uncultured Tateyamaria sp. TaxID=455651 RepID=UPI00262CA383|nr:hypothetical protein [uncultured Tateyamaria sp.]